MGACPCAHPPGTGKDHRRLAMFLLRAVYNALRAIYNASIVSAGSSVGSTAAFVVSLLISVAVVVLYLSLFALPLIWLLNR